MLDLRELYQEVIIDHNKNPRNFHKLPCCSHTAEGFNPLCGDKITLYVDVASDKIADISFQGAGCAISTASASLMTEIVKGKKISEAKNIFSVFHDLLMGKENALTPDLMGKLTVLAGVKAYPARVKCATLAWHAFQTALQGDKSAVSTE